MAARLQALLPAARDYEISAVTGMLVVRTSVPMAILKGKDIMAIQSLCDDGAPVTTLAPDVAAPYRASSLARRLRIVSDLNSYLSELSLDDAMLLSSCSFGCEEDYAAALLKLINLMKRTPAEKGRFFVALHAISRVTVRSAMRRIDEELIYAIGQNGADDLRRILLGTCFAAQARDLIGLGGYTQSNHDLLLEPWRTTILERKHGPVLR